MQRARKIIQMEDERSALREQRFAVEKEFAYKRFISDEDDAAVQAGDDVIEIFSEKRVMSSVES